MLLTRRAVLVELISVAAALLAFWEFWVQTIPEIRPSGSDPSAPFLLPFVVKNNSSFFSIYSDQWFCGAYYKDNQGTVARIDAEANMSRNANRIIKPGISSIFHCSIRVPGQDIKSLSATSYFRYHTLWFARSRDLTFTWIADGQHSQWIEGEE
jgi:hypothetical protein